MQGFVSVPGFGPTNSGHGHPDSSCWDNKAGVSPNEAFPPGIYEWRPCRKVGLQANGNHAERAAYRHLPGRSLSTRRCPVQQSWLQSPAPAHSSKTCFFFQDSLLNTITSKVGRGVFAFLGLVGAGNIPSMTWTRASWVGGKRRNWSHPQHHSLGPGAACWRWGFARCWFRNEGGG